MNAGPDALDRAIRLLETHDQGHLVRHAGTLAPAAREAFLLEAATCPWAELRRALAEPEPGASPSLRPPQGLTLKRQQGEGGLRGRLAELGRGLLAGGRVATLLLAGGQGTRLGYDGPKGCFPFGPDEARTLFRVQAERLVAMGRWVGKPIPFFVLVSDATEEATREAFADPTTYGLEADQVRILRQRSLPAFDAQGRALLAGPGRLATAPDGHGGAIPALADAGVIDELAEREVDVLTTFQVDNPLALPVDPVMLGWMVERRAQAMGKAVARLPDEKVGVFARDIEGRHRVVEYSEFPEGGMPDELTMGSIALHAFSVTWLKRLLDGGLFLPYHLARKTVPFLDETGTLVRPTESNGVKLERFIFDVFPLADRVEVHEVEREREFAPVKNAEGVDSPETARRLVAEEVVRWYEARGAEAPTPPALAPLAMLEATGVAP